MIVISGTLTLDPAKIDEFMEAAHRLEELTRAEAGCGSYGYWPSHDQPGTVLVFEEWADEDALNAHIGSAHMAEFMGAAGGFGITGLDLQRYDVSDKTKFM